MLNFEDFFQPDCRSNICVNINEIFTPATAKGYSQSDLLPSCLSNNSRNNSCVAQPEIRDWIVERIYSVCQREKHGMYRIILCKENEVLQWYKSTTPVIK